MLRRVTETDANALEGRGADSAPTYSRPITPGSRLDGLGIIHSEKMKWRWAWPAALPRKSPGGEEWSRGGRDGKLQRKQRVGGDRMGVGL